MKKLIAKILKKALAEKGIELKEEEIEGSLEIPPSSDLGDYSFPCFSLKEKLKDNPVKIASEIKNKINSSENFESIQAKGAYINFFLNREKIAGNLIKEILKEKDNFGKPDAKKKEKIMIEFSQANTHKAFHVGHIRGTSIGESLARIFEFSGEKVLRANYQGDSGMHVAKWIWCYKKYHSKEKLRKDESWIASIYVDSVKHLAENELLQKEVDVINRKLSEGKDKSLVSLWKKTRKLSLDSFVKIYKELNTHFDVYFFESKVEKSGKKITEELLKKRIAEISDDAIIVDLKKYNLGVWVLLRKDKTVLYSAKDLALAEEKFKKFKLDKNIYVIGAAQSLHMAQLFKTLELMKFKKAGNCEFVPFSEVRLPTGKMSSRTGENILYSDFLKEMTDYSKEEIKKRQPLISEKELENRALKISIASIKYFMLKQSSNRVIIFSKEDALNFEGDSGAYILYSYARASSIIKKAGKNFKKNLEKGKLESAEFELIKKLLQFKDIVLNSFSNRNPAAIANYSYQLSQLFNEFYHACPVINSDREDFRLSLINSFRQVLKNSLYLLGIEAIEEM
ncbi:Arginine--tRNA ligase [uncultured archaeon]|nr:Arginine--tRNA ligase [uncultured archaeon]